MTEKSLVEKRFSDIAFNIEAIRENIEKALLRAGRAENAVRLMAVTKTVDEIYINHAISCGIDLIGENRVQEMLRKKPNLHLDGVEKHLIGHLQTNKVSQIVGEVDMIQSVDSVKIAREIGKQSMKKGIVTDALLEINIGLEESKTGILPAAAMEAIAEIAEMKGIRIKGLMAIPPICENERILRNFFSDMYNMYVDIGAKKLDNISMDILSMGMSGDYEIAVEHGANLVRVGSSMFGARVY